MQALASHKLFLKAKPIASQMGCSSRRLACGKCIVLLELNILRLDLTALKIVSFSS